MFWRGLWVFLAVTFGISWGIGALGLYAVPGLLEGRFAAPLFFIAVYAPAFGAFAAAAACGKAAWRAFIARLFLVAPVWRWILIAAGLFLILQALAVLLTWLLGIDAPLWPYSGAGAFLLALLISPLSNPGSMEEPGWRGWLQPLLQERLSPLPAALVLGLIWGVWHLPVILSPAFPQYDASLPAWLSAARFFAQTMAISVILAAILNASRGAVAPAFFAHWAINLPWVLGVAGDTMTVWTALVTLAAILTVILRPDLFRREAAATAELERAA